MTIELESDKLQILLNLIAGLEYNEAAKEYKYKDNTYFLRSKNETGNNIDYFMVNTNYPEDVVRIKCTSNGIPTYDGFNKIKIPSDIMKKEYQKIYYKNKTKPKRQLNKKIKEPKIKKEQHKIISKKTIEPRHCEFCGKIFTPKQKTQRFDSNECRKKYYSKSQSIKEQEKRKIEKECPICGTTFKGNPRDIYCCPECYKKAQSDRRRKRYQRDKINGKYTKVTEIPKDDIDNSYNSIPTDTKETLVKQRIGQSKLRDLLLSTQNCCEICGIKSKELLIASHIKPWRKCLKTQENIEDNERGSINNVLLLCAIHDKLFDKGFITFDDSGKIKISKYLDKDDIKQLNIENKYINIKNPIQQKYIEYHRKNIFEKKQEQQL